MSFWMSASRYTFISGDQVDRTVLVSGRSVVGSLKTCRVAMIENTETRMIAGSSRGIFTRSASCSSEQPSTRAASYSSLGTARSAV
jgi:hypothetical protein